MRAAFILIVFAPLFTGCTTMFGAKQLNNGLPFDPNAPNIYTIDARDGGSRMRNNFEFREGMTIQDALVDSGLIDRYPQMDILLKRRSADPNKAIPMPATYDRKTRSVKPETNYALHPGDYLIIEKDNTSMIEELVNPILEPLGLD